jgi:hypothetical protein
VLTVAQVYALITRLPLEGYEQSARRSRRDSG